MFFRLKIFKILFGHTIIKIFRCAAPMNTTQLSLLQILTLLCSYINYRN